MALPGYPIVDTRLSVHLFLRQCYRLTKTLYSDLQSVMRHRPDSRQPRSPTNQYSIKGQELQWSERHLRRRRGQEQDYPAKKTFYPIEY